MGTKKLFSYALDSASIAIDMVKRTDFKRITPDTEWDVRQLANHMLYELSWLPDLVGGKTVKEVGAKYDGDLIADDLLGHWQQAERRARKAVRNAKLKDTVHLSWKDDTNDYYIRQMASELLIHSWDLSAALHKPLKFDTDLTEAVYDDIYRENNDLSSSGLYAKAIQVSDGSDIQTRLLALTGRDINWQ